MQAKEFGKQNIVMGKNQKEYLPLPAHKATDGTVTMCMELSEEEKKKILETGCIWVQLLTFGQPMQPLRFSTEEPEMERNLKLEQQIEAYERSQKQVKKAEGRAIRLGKRPRIEAKKEQSEHFVHVVNTIGRGFLPPVENMSFTEEEVNAIKAVLDSSLPNDGKALEYFAAEILTRQLK